MQQHLDALAEPAVDWSQRVVPQVQTLTAYQPGITEEKLRRDTGLEEIFKFSSNEAPFTPSPAIESAMREALKRGNRYPDGQALLDSLSERLAVPVDTITIGNGSIDIIASLVRGLVTAGQNVVLSRFGYSAYPAFVIEQGADIRLAASGPHFGHSVDAILEKIDRNTRLILLDSPTNLSGCNLEWAELKRLLANLPRHVVLILDQAYIEFAEASAPEPLEQLPLYYPNVVVTRTFSKAYGLAGMRVGYSIADAGLVRYLIRIRPPFPVSGVALAGALAALGDRAHLDHIVNHTLRERPRLAGALADLGIGVVDGCANFLLADFSTDAARVHEGLLARGFITRRTHPYGLPNHIRITIGTCHENELLVDAVRTLLQTRSH